MEDDLSALFAEVMSNLPKPPNSPNRKEEQDDLDSVGTDYFGSPATVHDFGDPGEDLDLPLNTGPLNPVGNKDSEIQIDWGFSSSDENKELDELGEEFRTYSSSRSFSADVISYIERYYYSIGNIPTFGELHEVFSDYPERPRYIKGWKTVLEEVKNAKGKTVQDLLELRGLPTFRTADNYLDPRFIAACHLILNPHDKRSDIAKLKDVGIKSAQWNAWLKRKPYFEYYKDHADRIFDGEIQTEAKRALGDLVRSRDLSAIKYVDERTGVYRTNNGANADTIGAFLQAMFAILARTVSTDVINTIQAQLRQEPVIQELLGNQNVIEAQAS